MTPYIQVSPQGNNTSHFLVEFRMAVPHFLVEFRMAVRMILSLLKLVRTFVLYSIWCRPKPRLHKDHSNNPQMTKLQSTLEYIQELQAVE